MKCMCVFKAYFTHLKIKNSELTVDLHTWYNYCDTCIYVCFAFQDYRVSHIDLFTEPEGLGLLNSYFDDTEEMQGFGVMQKTCSIQVHWGT